MHLIQVSILAIFLSFFIGCNDFGNNLEEMSKTQGLFKKAIDEKYGLKTNVTWRNQNGVFTQVTISFHAEEVRDKKVAELEAMAIEAVKSSLKSNPKVINVNIVSKIQNSEENNS